MNFEPIKVVIGVLVRYFLMIVAGFLGNYGLTEGQQGEFVEAAVPIVVSVLIAAGLVVWSYFTRKWAYEADPNEEQ